MANCEVFSFRTVSATPPAQRLLRLKEAAVYLGVSEWTLRQMAHNSEIQFIQRTPQSPMLFDLNDLDAWIEQSKQGQATARKEHGT